ncbi:Plug and carboxypeptidase regulatory-like domain-containing protein [Maribacter litopenaei]|uniref:Plug and carboxypeptidase regulatory-like domain-containing protein n=1 Tax=Maribacter litopenaei TaxID=2976127 RepID=A0ABY5Y3X9_9FLAO|nr:Plug and carboxypeptidase regulatory-like domain-containing protein [Maribacter litopenaei]UWX53722.1 Plug and carboxypeptidase regulatory-like domain-containing protein [Maribacter litopenaei]
MKTNTLVFTLLSFVLMMIQGWAQEEEKEKDSLLQVFGTVMDSKGDPIAGALMLVDSVTSNISTNTLGQYTLKVPPKTTLISAYSKNYGVLDHPFSSEPRMDFQWNEENTRKLSKSKLKALGYATVNGSKGAPRDRSKDYTKYQNIYQMLMAEVPGVIANGNSIQLRGTAVSSINSGHAPLFIVDGTRTSSIEWINPVEVKSFRVIRDEGTSVYGVRGANGVVIIELKK